MSEEWCTIESDPGVFSELISLFGVKDVAVEEIYSLETNDAEISDPYHLNIASFGFVFLFKWKKELEQDHREVVDASNFPGLFFARQVVTNACATQAVLGVLLNAESIALGEHLEQLKSFTAELDSETKGLAIGNSDLIRSAHNSFARAEPFFVEKSSAQSGDGEDPYHFVAYIPFHGSVFEIDGLKSGPILLGHYDEAGGDWRAVARPQVEARMQRYSSAETHFTLLNVCQKRSSVLDREISALEQELATLGTSPEEVQLMEGKADAYRRQLLDEREKEANQAAENVRRRHNYVPAIVEILHALARTGKLEALCQPKQPAAAPVEN